MKELQSSSHILKKCLSYLGTCVREVPGLRNRESTGLFPGFISTKRNIYRWFKYYMLRIWEYI